ncbi:MAG: WD40/YVTN/BNR-like repeat-containing protein, partial [Chitinophagaceae bacterium]
MKTSIFLVLTFSFLGISAMAQKSPASPSASSKLSHPSDSLLFSGLTYRLIGPFRGGRVDAVAGDLSHKNVFYFGATGGGVWMTRDGGSNWKNISDGYFGGSIGAIAIAPSDPLTLYAGTGENTLRGNLSEGDGIWKSTDGGRTWKHRGLTDSRHIARIVIDPKNPEIVWVAAMGHAFSPNLERGVFKTTDGGRSWKKVLYAGDQAGAVDLQMDPTDPQILYASTWRVLRTPYSLESGGSGCGLWKTMDGGETWKNISSNPGFAQDTLGIICLTICRSNPDHLYAMVEAKKGGLFSSQDGGKTWTLVNSSNDLRQRAWYFSRVYADPQNENTVYVLNVSWMRSKDGGKTFQNLPDPHADHHDLWIDPHDPKRMILGDDGGAEVSFDGGQNFSSMLNQPTAQIYRVSTDNHFPYRVLGAQQDNSTIRILSRTYGGEIGNSDWQPTAGAESGYVVADPLDPDVVYGGNYGGYLSRLDHKTGENRAINAWPDDPIGSPAGILRYRFQWNFPIFFSPNNPHRLYAAANVLFRTDNDGQSWKVISPDLTTNDKSRQLSSGGLITQDNSTVEYYCTIFTATESWLEKDLLWAGSDDGLLHISRDGGKNWENVTPKGMPKWMRFNSIDINPFQKGGAYVVGYRFKLDDYTPYIYRTENYGKTWKLITTGIPANDFARVVRADPKIPGLLYCGTQQGMYISMDDGDHWKAFQLNLPIVPITDLTIKEGNLVVATQGRAFWILDNLNMVEQLKKSLLQKNFFVFRPAPAFRMEGSQDSHVRNAGTNPPNGVIVNYYIRHFPDSGKLTIAVMDSLHELIRTFRTQAKKPKDLLKVHSGMNQLVWNLDYPAALKIKGMVLWEGTVGSPKAPPGKYWVSLKMGKDSVTRPFRVLADPNYLVSQQAYMDQFHFLIQVRDKFSQTQRAILKIRDIRAQMKELIDRLGEDCPQDLKDSCASINKSLTEVEQALDQTKAKSGEDLLNYPIRLNDKLAGVFNVANSGYMAPSKQVREVY